MNSYLEIISALSRKNLSIFRGFASVGLRPGGNIGMLEFRENKLEGQKIIIAVEFHGLRSPENFDIISLVKFFHVSF